MSHVCREFAVLLRCSDRYKMRIREFCSLVIRSCEPQPARIKISSKDFRQAGFEEWEFASSQFRQLSLVDIHPEDIVPKLCHTGRVSCT
ncbi:hypothetical protein ACNUDN_01532 [Mycobacterium sp. smrl_JER01]